MSASAVPLLPDPIDPLAPAPAGRYEDDVVVVARRPGGPRRAGAVHTSHFDVWRGAGRLQVGHDLPPERIDGDLGALLAEELFRPGWVTGNDTFERVFTGIVLGGAPDPAEAWELFYRRTLARPRGEIAELHEHAAGLLPPGSVLELGCCFGFLGLRLAAAGARVTVSDISEGTVRLLATVAPRLGIAVDTQVCDAALVPCADDTYDAVTVLHLLEHLDPAHGAAVVAEAVRVARSRVLVAVPYEDEPDPLYGHVRSMTPAELAALGRASCWNASVHPFHGGWLVLDRP